MKHVEKAGNGKIEKGLIGPPLEVPRVTTA
jgi:hypothetical protein